MPLEKHVAEEIVSRLGGLYAEQDQQARAEVLKEFNDWIKGLPYDQDIIDYATEQLEKKISNIDAAEQQLGSVTERKEYTQKYVQDIKEQIDKYLKDTPFLVTKETALQALYALHPIQQATAKDFVKFATKKATFHGKDGAARAIRAIQRCEVMLDKLNVEDVKQTDVTDVQREVNSLLHILKDENSTLYNQYVSKANPDERFNTQIMLRGDHPNLETWMMNSEIPPKRDEQHIDPVYGADGPELKR